MLLNRLFRSSKSRPAAAPWPRPVARLSLEALADRIVPSTFTVGNLADSGPGSLRQAVLDAGPRPFAAVRVVVDTPEHELLRAGTLRHGITALRVLSSVFPAFTDWHHCVALSRR